jgi:excisionase family DNA binding protein
MEPMASDGPAALMTFRAAAERVGLSRRTLHRMVAAGTFPAAVVVPGMAGPQGRRLRREDVEAWVDRLNQGSALG